MNVITANNLKAPMPSKDWTNQLKASLARFAPAGSPLTAGLLVDDWDGPQAVHSVYSVSMATMERGLDSVTNPICWRCLAGRPNARTASVCWASPAIKGLPVVVACAMHGSAAADVLASIARLNHLKEVSDYPAHHYELRILRIPALFLETFWLKPQVGETSDVIVPYGGVLNSSDELKLPGGGTLKRNQAIPVEAFMTTTREAAKVRIAQGCLKARRPADDQWIAQNRDHRERSAPNPVT
jgi:hypothetical protein